MRVRNTSVLTNMPIRPSSRGLAATGDGRADRDVAGSRQPRQQHRERRVRHHEDRRVVAAGQRDHVTMEVGGQLSSTPSRRGTTACTGRGRSVGRSSTSGRSARAASQYSVWATVGAVRVVLGAEQLSLPQRVIRVLHRQRRPLRCLLPNAGPVGGHQVGGRAVPARTRRC